MKIDLARCLTVVLLAWAGLPAPAADDLPLLKPKVKTLAAFKNGLGFVFKSGTVQPVDGWLRLDQLPSAALGSLWIGTTKPGTPVTEVVAYKQKVSEEVDAINLAELLAAHVGRRVAVKYAIGSETVRVEGTLLAVPADRKPDETTLAPATPPVYGSYRPPVESTRSDLVLIRTMNMNQPTVTAISEAVIRGVEILDTVNLKTKIEREVGRAKVHIGGNPASAEITMVYLEKGLTWSPSYRVNLANERNAELSMDAVLVNDVEDLEEVEVSFVVGYPNFLYADLVTPLSLQQTVANFIQALPTARRNDQAGPFRNVMSQSLAYNTASFDASSRPEALYSATQPMAGETSEDLYFYKKPAVTLKKGERARYEVLTASVPYEHLYQWDVLDSMNVDDRGYRQDSSANRKEPENHVWHVLRLENTTRQPWTTAPAFAVNGAMPVAQDVLSYAPPGAKSTLKLTVASDLRAESSQTETARKAVNIEGRSLDDVTVAGKLKVTNWKAKETSLVVRKALVGEVLTAGEGKVTKVARKLTSVNPNSEIEWEFRIPPGKDKELTYQYRVLIYR